MADYKFNFTVSGVTLTDAQKSKISQAIGAAVATALIEDSPKGAAAVTSDFLNLCNIHGGIRIPAADVAALKVSEVLAKNAVA